MRKFRTHSRTFKSPPRKRRTNPRSALAFVFPSVVTTITLNAMFQSLAVASPEIEEQVVKQVEQVVEQVEQVVEQVDLSTFTKAQLLEHATAIGVKVFKSWNKTKIIEKLSE